MINRLFINDKDAYLTWGVLLQKGAYSNIIMPANNKPYTTNEQRSTAGTQVFFDNPQPQERTFQVNFVILADTEEEYLQKFNSFVNELNLGNVKMRIPTLKMEINIYVDSYLNLSYFKSKGIFNVRFNEPNTKNRIYL